MGEVKPFTNGRTGRWLAAMLFVSRRRCRGWLNALVLKPLPLFSSQRRQPQRVLPSVSEGSEYRAFHSDSSVPLERHARIGPTRCVLNDRCTPSLAPSIPQDGEQLAHEPSQVP